MANLLNIIEFLLYEERSSIVKLLFSPYHSYGLDWFQAPGCKQGSTKKNFFRYPTFFLFEMFRESA